MSKADSNAAVSRGKPQKPNKPRPDFPHAAGVWAKKIRGKLHYFAPWDDPDGALAKYNAQKEALHDGRKPREETDGVTVKELMNQFLVAKESLVKSGELTQRSWDDYKDACDLVIEKFGKSRRVADLDPADFSKLRAAMLAKGWGPVTLGNVIQRTRVVFKFAYDNGTIDRPVRYGQEFKRPSRKTVRIDRAKKGPKLFTAEEVRAIINGALIVGDDGPQLVQAGKVMRAMVLLCINAGFGNADCGHLAQMNLNLDAGVIDFPRPKTGIPRRCVLWPETVAALREALAIRPKPKDAAHEGPRRQVMRRHFTGAATALLVLVCFLPDRPAVAYIQTPVTMKGILAQTQLIFTAKVDAFDPEKRTAVLVVDVQLKGKVPFKKLLIALDADKEGAREYNKPSHLVKRLAVKQTVVIFADSKEGAFAPIRRGNLLVFLYVNGTWVQFAAETTDDGPAELPLRFHHFEPYLQRTFKGTSEEMREVIIDCLKGKKEPPRTTPRSPAASGRKSSDRAQPATVNAASDGLQRITPCHPQVCRSSRRVASALGGSITVESEPGRGCRMRVRLPNSPREDRIDLLANAQTPVAVSNCEGLR